MNYEKIYQKNMQVLQKYMPTVYKNVLHQNIDHLELIANEDKSHNIVYKGKKIYPDNTIDMINKQSDVFLINPPSLFELPKVLANSWTHRHTNKRANSIISKSPIIFGHNIQHNGYIAPKKEYPFFNFIWYR